MGALPKYCSPRCKEASRSPEAILRRREQHREHYFPAYYERNKDQILQRNKKWIEEHPGKGREYMSVYRKRHADEIKERVRAYHLANREKLLKRKKELRNPEKDKEYRLSHREEGNRRAREWQAKYRAQNPEEHRAKQREWRRNNPETYVAKNHRYQTNKTQAGGSYTKEEWLSLIEKFGNKCLCCRRSDVKLTVDHVVPVSRGGTSNIDNLQPLCKPCNIRKHDRTIDYRVNVCP